MFTQPPLEQNTCNLDCLKKNPIKTFDGPVKIVLVDIPRKEYWQRIWWAGLIGLSYLMMGFTTITMLLFACSWKVSSLWENFHIFSCTAGFQIFMPAAVLLTTNLNGPSAPLKPSGRKVNHIVLQVAAAIFNIIGPILILVKGPHKWPAVLVESGHCFTGMVSLVLHGLTIIFVPFLFTNTPCSPSFKSLHACLGLCSYFASSISFIQSFFKKSFTSWLPVCSIVMAILVAFYTAVIIAYPVHRLICADRCENRILPAGFK